MNDSTLRQLILQRLGNAESEQTVERIAAMARELSLADPSLERAFVDGMPLMVIYAIDDFRIQRAHDERELLHALADIRLHTRRANPRSSKHSWGAGHDGPRRRQLNRAIRTSRKVLALMAA